MGPSKKEFTVHADVFAKLSDPLNVLINGNFSEATEKTVVWDDVDEATFDRLRQFAYSGDYQGAIPVPLAQWAEDKLKPGEIPTAEFKASIDKYRTFVSRKHPRNKDNYRWKLPYTIGNMYDDLNDYQTATVTRKRKYEDFADEITLDGKALMIRALVLWFNFNPELKEKRMRLIYDNVEGEPFHNYKDLLYCHANLHILADRYCIEKLVDITTIKLVELLFRVAIFEWNLGHIADVIRYIFQNTLDGDQIRGGLIRFGAVIIDDVQENKEWAQLLLDVPEFSKGVIEKLVKHRLPESY